MNHEVQNSGHISTVMSGGSDCENSVLNTTPLIRNSMKQIENDDNSRDHSDHSEGSVIVCDQSEIKNRLNDSVRKALENYKEYKNEISFTLHSQNNSRFDDEINDHVENLSSIVKKMDDDTDSLLKTPISSHRSFKRQVEEMYNERSPYTNNQQMHSARGVSYQYEQQAMMKKTPSQQVFEYQFP